MLPAAFHHYFQGSNSVTGTVAQSLPRLSQAAATTMLPEGEVAQTLPKVAQAATGTERLSGVVAQALPLPQQAAQSGIVLPGAISQVLPSVLQAASATHPEDSVANIIGVVGGVFQPRGVAISGSNHVAADQADLWSDDSSVGTCVFSVYVAEPYTGWDLIFGDDGSYFYVRIDAFNGVEVVLYGEYDGSGYPILAAWMDNQTPTSFWSVGWHTVAASWDTNHPAGEKLIHIVVDGQVITPEIDDPDPAFQIEMDGSDGSSLWRIYTGGSGDYAVAEFWFKRQYLDVTDPSVLAQFFTADNKPRNLGPDGSWPTGSQPDIYFSARDSDAASVFASNRGSVGGWYEVGALELADPSPPPTTVDGCILPAVQQNALGISGSYHSGTVENLLGQPAQEILSDIRQTGVVVHLLWLPVVEIEATIMDPGPEPEPMDHVPIAGFIANTGTLMMR